MPVTATRWGLSAALLDRSTQAVFAPALVGVKRTVTVQVPFGGMLREAQVCSVTLNCPGSSPRRVIEPISKSAVPVFVTVIMEPNDVESTN